MIDWSTVQLKWILVPHSSQQLLHWFIPNIFYEVPVIKSLSHEESGDTLATVFYFLYVQIVFLSHYMTPCAFLASSVSLRSHMRGSRRHVWPAWSSTASAERRCLTSQTSCSSSRMWKTGHSAGSGSVLCFSLGPNDFKLQKFRTLFVFCLGMAHKWRKAARVWHEAANRISAYWPSGAY